MKKFLAAAVITASTLFAGENLSLPNNPMELMQMAEIAEKKAIVLANMNLKRDEVAAFGKLYDAYQVELIDMNIKYAELINSFAKNYEKLSNGKAKNILAQWKKLEKESIDLEMKYIAKFEKKLPATLVLRYFQIENKIGAMQEAALTNVIPLAKESAAK